MKKIFILFSTFCLFAFLANATVVYRNNPVGYITISSITDNNYNPSSGSAVYNTNNLNSDNSDLDGGIISEDQIICYNEIPEELTGESATGGSGTYNYQWQSSTDESSWTDIDDATDENCEISEALTQTTYFRRITKDDESNKVISNVITISVYEEMDAGEITSSQEVCYDSEPDTLTGTSATGGGGDYTYQWQKSTDGSSWDEIDDATSENYFPTSVSTFTYYRRAVTDNTCGTTVYSDSVYIERLEELDAGSISSSQTICYESVPDTLTGTSATGGSGEYIYQWQQSSDGSSWNIINRATNESYTPSELTASLYFRRAVTDNLCAITSYTDSVYVKVYDEVDGGIIIEDQTICFGTSPDQINTSISASGGVGEYEYQWQYSNDNENWTNIEGDDASNSYYQPEELTDTTYYRKQTTNYCGIAYSDTVTINVNEELSAGIISSSQGVCGESDPDTLTVTSATGGSGEYSYQWQQSANGSSWSDIDEAIEESYLPTRDSTFTFYRQKVSDKTCEAIVYSDTVYVELFEELNAGTISSSQTICYKTTPDSITGSSVTGGSGEYSYQWQQSTNGSSWSDIDDASEENYSPSRLKSSKYFRRAVTDYSCDSTVYSDTVYIKVYKELDGGEIEEDQTICNGDTPTKIRTKTSPSGGEEDYVYQWQYSYDNVSWEEIDNANYKYYQPEELTESIYYRKETSDQCGSVFSNNVLVTVENEFTPGTIGEDQIVTKNGSIYPITTIEEPSTTYGLVYQWQQSADGETWEDIDGETGDFLYISSLEETTYYRKKVTTNCGEGYTDTVTISINTSLDPGTISSSQTICYNSVPDELTGTSASSDVDTLVYSWESSLDSVTWSEIDGETDESYQPDEITELTYFRRKVESDSLTAYSNVIYVNTYDEVEVPSLSAEDSYCSGDEVTLEINSSDNVVWYDMNKDEIQQSDSFTYTADPDTQYYYTVIDSIGCYGELTLADITIDYVDVDISTNYDDIEDVTNGDAVVFYPNIESNVDDEELDYTWTFTHEDKGWYETLYDMEPEEYFHWEGWYSIELDVDMPSGCAFSFNKDDYMYVLEEVDDDVTKSGAKGRDVLSEDFGTQDSSTVIINLYPNPVADILYIDVQNNTETLPVKIFNSIGTLVYQDTLEKNELLKTVNTSTLNTGIYYITIGSDNYKLIKK